MHRANPLAGRSQMNHRFVNIVWTGIVAPTRDEMPDGAESNAHRKIRLLDGKIPRRTREGHGGGLTVLRAIQRDVQVSSSLGRGEPFPLATV